MTIIIAILMIVISPSVKPLDQTPLTIFTSSSDQSSTVPPPNKALATTDSNTYFHALILYYFYKYRTAALDELT